MRLSVAADDGPHLRITEETLLTKIDKALGSTREMVIGDKEFVRDEVQRYRQKLGVNHFIMRVQWPGLEHEKVLRTIRTLGNLFG